MASLQGKEWVITESCQMKAKTVQYVSYNTESHFDAECVCGFFLLS